MGRKKRDRQNELEGVRKEREGEKGGQKDEEERERKTDRVNGREKGRGQKVEKESQR